MSRTSTRSLVAARPKTLDPVRPNAGIERNYARRLEKLIEEMHRSVLYWVRAAYRKRPPEAHRVHAMDDSPASALLHEVKRLQRRWLRKFDELSKNLAAHFVKSASERSDAQLSRVLREAGFTVKFQTTRAVNDVIQAAISENVGLIKSIPQKYLGDVEGAVMRSVQRGRDLKGLTEELQSKYHVTRKRASLIARDQNNKATAFVQRTRQTELGIAEAIWVHSAGGRHPRTSHVKAGRDKVRYDVKVGWFDPEEQRYVFPGELINCRCVCRPVVPGLS